MEDYDQEIKKLLGSQWEIIRIPTDRLDTDAKKFQRRLIRYSNTEKPIASIGENYMPIHRQKPIRILKL